MEIRDAASLRTADVLSGLSSTAAGLGSEEARRRLEQLCPNAVRSHGARPLTLLVLPQHRQGQRSAPTCPMGPAAHRCSKARTVGTVSPCPSPGRPLTLEAMDSVDKAPPRPRRRSVAWTVAEIIVLALAVYLLLPQLAGIERVGHRLATALWWVSMLALLLETASLLAYGELIRTALRATGRGVPHTLAFRVVLAGTALGKTLPGGTTAAMPFVIRSLHATGIRPATAAATVAGSGMISSAVLAALLPLAVLVSVVGGDGRGMAPEGIALALVTAAAVAGVFALLRDPATVATVVRRGVRLASHGPLRRRLDPDQLAAAAEAAGSGLHQLSNGPALRRAVAWAAANWLLDAAALAMMAVAVGRDVPWAGLLLAYILGQLVAAAPLTPGGVGVVETSMIAALVAQGASGAGAAATVLAWRLISHWIPIVVGLITLPTLPNGSPHRARPDRS